MMTQPKSKTSLRLFLCCCSLLICCSVSYQSLAQGFSDSRQRIEDQLMRLQLDEAQATIPELANPAYEAFYQATIHIYRFFASQNRSHIQQLRAIWPRTIESVKKLSESDSLKYTLLSELYCKRAGLEFMDENYLLSVRFARLGHQAIHKNQRRFPDNREQMKLLGLFEITFAAVPRKYQWLTQPMGLKGDANEGMRLLNVAGEYSSLLRMEAQLLATYVEKNMLNQPELALQRLEKEKIRSGENRLLDYFLGLAYLNVRQSDLAIETFTQSIEADSQRYDFPFMDYQLGKSYYFKGQHREAQKHLARFLKYYQGELFRSDACFRLGMSLCIEGNYQLGKRFFEKLLKQAQQDFDQDEYARFMAQKFVEQRPSAAHLRLFEARNRFDGGYFGAANTILSELQAQSERLDSELKTELHYRQGRLFHTQGKFSEAMHHYRLSIQSEAKASHWMQVYALYHLGEISKQQGEYPQARQYYRQALAEDDYFYQAGLENRCKVRLAELRRVN